MNTEVLPLGRVYDTGDQGRIGALLNEHVHMPLVENQLRERHLLGDLKRFSGSEKQSMSEVFKAYKLHQDGILGVYVLRAAEVVIGLATVDPQPKLRKLRYEMPPRLAKSRLSSSTEVYGPEVTAWINPAVVPHAEDRLSDAYAVLKDSQGPAIAQYDQYRLSHADSLLEPVQGWTIEPLDTAGWVHRAIKKAGFTSTKSNVGYYDDGESSRHSPPLSRLYIAGAPLNLT